MNCCKWFLTGFCLALITQPGQAAIFLHDPSWPTVLNQFNWGVKEGVEANTRKSASGIAVDRNKGLVYSLVREKPYVRVFREDGTFVRAWSQEKVGNVHMIHVGPEGNVWIADNGAHTVTKYTPEGKLLLTLGTFNEPGMDGKHFNGPTDIATTADGKYIFISDGYVNNRVAKFNSSGKYLGMWGGAKPGTAPGQFILPHSITVLDKRVYVADRSGGRIQVFDLDGNFIDEWRDKLIPWAVEAYQNRLYAIGSLLANSQHPTSKALTQVTINKAYQGTVPPVGQNIIAFDKTGHVLHQHSLPQGRQFGEVDWVHGVDIGTKGDIYLADVIGNHVQKWRVFSGPKPSLHENTNYSTDVYWGDAHLHTDLSTDAYALGNRLDSEAAYRFARGEAVTLSDSKTVRLRRPLDFLVIADHAENLGVAKSLQQRSPLLMQSEVGSSWFQRIRQGLSESGQINDLWDLHFKVDKEIGNADFRQSVWETVIDRAEQYNDSGKFTAFIGFEWSSRRPYYIHRVVVFKDGFERASQVLPYSSHEGNDPEQLWAYLDQYQQKTGGDVLAIPHNANLSDGKMFMPIDFQGNAFSRDYAKRRNRWEPLFEVTQIKGTSETHPILSPNDEFADFEILNKRTYGANPDDSNRIDPDKKRYEYARPALKLGLRLQAQLGVNPFKFGLIGSTDSHSSLSGEEVANQRETPVSVDPIKAADFSVAGYAAVWAATNTRAALFDAMKRKEVYASSGPRITVRFFGGWDYQADDALDVDLAYIGYQKGVPMGGDLTEAPLGKPPSFLIRAVKDPDGANLDRIQVIKGWLDSNGNSHEKIYDAARTDDNGLPELAVVWWDPDFDRGEPAFYYLRVIQRPTPRWAAYDVKTSDPENTPETIPMTTRERAFTSPIWYLPSAKENNHANLQ